MTTNPAVFAHPNPEQGGSTVEKPARKRWDDIDLTREEAEAY